MKYVFNRLLSALLALCMVVGAFTVVFSATAMVGAEETGEDTEVVKGETINASVDAETVRSTLYASPEDKLRTMSKITALLDKDGKPVLDQYGQTAYEYSPWIASGDYELYVQEATGEVAVKNKKTGQVLFSNPYDVKSIGQASQYEPMFAQLNISYEIIKEGKSGTMNSFTDAALRKNQIKVSYIKNGVCVEYTIGRADQRRLVPMAMEKYRWETVLYQKMAGDAHVQKKFRAFYTLIDLNYEQIPPNEISRYESDYPVLKKYHQNNLYTSEDYDPALESEYKRYPYYAPVNFNGTHDKANYIYGVPYQGRMSLYVLGGATDQEKNKIEEYIRSWVPEYNYDTLAYDHELVQYTEIAAAIPLFRMALEYRLDESGFSVRLPANSITFDEDNFRLTSIDVLPYMGAGNSENNGYIFIPDGSGTLIRFEDAKQQPNGGTVNNGMLYGPDNAYHSLGSNYSGKNEAMRYPVFGIIENDKIVYQEGENGALTEVCPHRYVTKTIEADCATQTNGGIYEYCAICGHLKSVTNEKAYEHKGTMVTTVKADCRNEGKATITCDVCKGTYEYTIPKTEHTYREFIVADKENHICYVIEKCAGTYTTTDENGQTVTVECGQINEEFEKVETDHSYDEEWTEIRENGRCYRTNTCSECGFFAEEELEHVLEGEGEIVHDKKAHRCYLKNTCTECGAVVEEELEHELGEGVYAENAEGLCVMTETCANCGYEKLTYGRHSNKDNGVKKADKTNHYCYVEHTCENCAGTFTVGGDHSIENGVCTACGFAEEQTEQYVHTNGKCYRILCDKDGKEIGRVAIDHEFASDSYVNATCTEWGYTAYACVNCGFEAGKQYVKDDPETAPIGHDYQWDSEEKTSCLEGYTSHLKCVHCGDVKESKQVEADGHEYDAGECIVPATKGHGGLYVYTCQYDGCGHTYYETREPLTEDAEPDDGEDTEGEDTEDTEGEEGEEGEEGDEPVADDATYIEVPRTHGFLAIMTAGSALATLKAEYKNNHSYLYTYMNVNPRPQDSYNLADAVSSGADAVWTVVSERKYSGSYTLKYIMLQDTDYSAVKEGTSIDVVYGNSTFDADYTGMAAAYRNYLITTGALKPLDVNENGIPLYLEAFGATSIASSFLTFPTVETVPLTTFEDLKTVVNELHAITDEEGNVVYSIENIKFKLNGFTNGGMISTMPYKVEFEDVVGGNGGFKDFVSFAKENEIGVYPDFDFAYVEKVDMFDGYSDSKHAVKTIDGRYIMKRDYDPTIQIFSGTGLTAISASVYDYFFDAFTANYAKYENSGVSVGSLGTDLNSDFDEDDPYNREDSREFTERMLAKLQKEYGSVMINGGNAYALPYADHVLNMSLNGSQQLATSESIPFMSMVLHGCVNYAGTATNMASSLELEILNIIENGASPYFIIATQNTRYLKENNALSKYYSVDYSTWKQDMIDTYRVLNESLKDVQGAQFIVHEYVKGYRLPDADDNYSQFEEAGEIIIKAIENYNKAVDRYQKAVALVERHTVTEVLNRLENADKTGIYDILARYDFADSLEESRFEALDVKLTAEEVELIKALTAEIEEYEAYGSRDSVKGNVTEAEKALATATETYNNTMTQYGYLFNVKPDENGNYNANDFRVLNNFTGAVYEQNGKYVIASEGIVDAEGNPVKSDSEINNDSIVKVGYDNGVEFYLNYNYFDVVISVNGEQIVIGGYDFVKVENK